MPGVVEAPSVIMAGVFELEMDGHSGPGGGHIPTGALGSASLAAEGASNGADLEVEVDEENISKDAMAVDMREMKEPDMQKLNEVRDYGVCSFSRISLHFLFLYPLKHFTIYPADAVISINIQGDHSRCVKPPVDIKIKVP